MVIVRIIALIIKTIISGDISVLIMDAGDDQSNALLSNRFLHLRPASAITPFVQLLPEVIRFKHETSELKGSERESTTGSKDMINGRFDDHWLGRPRGMRKLRQEPRKRLYINGQVNAAPRHWRENIYRIPLVEMLATYPFVSVMFGAAYGSFPVICFALAHSCVYSFGERDGGGLRKVGRK
jgi:hypothetical protein